MQVVENYIRSPLDYKTIVIDYGTVLVSRDWEDLKGLRAPP